MTLDELLEQFDEVLEGGLKITGKKTVVDVEKLKITINMTNCFSVAGVPYETELFRGNNKTAKRGSSLDVMLFELPCSFDAGRGFDYITDFWNFKSKSENRNGSSWYQSKNCVPWSLECIPDYDYKTDKGGIYTLDKLEQEYNNYKNGLESIVIGTQHFDFGDENLCIDVTDYVLKCIRTNTNYGLCLSCLPFYEKKNLDELQIIDFFNDNTNTFCNVYGVKKINISTVGKHKYPINKIVFNRLSGDLNTHNILHPTQKPVAILEYLIKTYTLENETVLDNCMGSGSTGVACINTNRNFIGIEKDDKYFEIAKNRIEKCQKSIFDL